MATHRGMSGDAISRYEWTSCSHAHRGPRAYAPIECHLLPLVQTTLPQTQALPAELCNLQISVRRSVVLRNGLCLNFLVVGTVYWHRPRVARGIVQNRICGLAPIHQALGYW